MMMLRCTATGLAVAVLFGCATPDQKPDPQSAAVGELSASVGGGVEGLYQELDVQQTANRLNERAWYDIRDGDLVLIRNGRDAITRIDAETLSYEFAPGLSGEPSSARAEVFFGADGFGRRLLDLTRGERVLPTEEYGALSGRRFGFQQWYDSLPIWNARAVLELDAGGRFSGLESSLIPDPAPETGDLIPESEAVAAAIADLLSLDDPLWQGVTPELESVERVIVDLLPITGRDATRPAYLVKLRPPEDQRGGRRDVVVDALDGTVLVSIEKVDLVLDSRDSIFVPRDPAMASDPDDFVLEWPGNMAECPPRRTDGPLGADPMMRDIDEARGAMCETVRFFADRGGEFVSTDFRQWIDRSGNGLRVNLSADIGGASVGVNWGDDGIGLAPGVGRAEIIGHEFGHYLFNRREGLATFKGGGADGAAIEEHMNDLLGMIIEQRGGFVYRHPSSGSSPPHEEDRCLMNDDPDSLDTQARLTMPPPCRTQRLPWRSACQPELDNSGHCEGARRAIDLASNPRYDLLGSGTEITRISHTDLGVGNRAMSALIAPTSSRTVLDGWHVSGLGLPTFERLFLGASLALPEQSSWSDYARAWTESGRRIGVGATAERHIRGALLAGYIWDLPHVVMTADASSPVLGGVSPLHRPAAASLILSDGTERTYFFYRESGSVGEVHYVWRNEVPGFSFADTPRGAFTGPCRLEDVVTDASVAAVGRADRLFVAWAEPTETPSVGRLDGLRLRAVNAGDGGCTDVWEAYPPGLEVAEDGEIRSVERLLRGGPALALWHASTGGGSDIPAPEQAVTPPPWIRCVPNPAALPDFAGRPFPISPIERGGFLLGPCFYDPRVPQQPPVPLPAVTVNLLDDLFVDAANRRAARSVPSLIDPRAPSLVPEEQAIAHAFMLSSAVSAHAELQSVIDEVFRDIGRTSNDPFETEVPTSQGGAFLPRFGFPFATGTVRYTLPNGFPVITLARGLDTLVLAFRDPEGRLRIVDYEDRRSTDSSDGTPQVPVLAEGMNGSDPALAVVPMRRDREFLVAVYGVPHNGRATGLAYRTARSRSTHPLTAGLFRPAARIDRIRGREAGFLRRMRDYAYARTFEAPVVAASKERLHLFTAELGHLGDRETDYTIAPGDPNSSTYDPYPNTSQALLFTKDHIRYAILRMTESGTLEAHGERPVQLPYTAVSDGEAPTPQVGTAQRTQQRNQLRYYQPGRSQVMLRSRPVR